MGLKEGRFVASFSFLFAFATLAQAAPTLRLVTSTVGPVSIATGSTGGTQIIEAYNAGDGSLNLTASSSVSWITAAIQAARSCTSTSLARTCTPIAISLNTASLGAGTSTGIVTIADPNAVDAPQTITVTVQMGGSVPNTVNAYVAPNGAADIPITTNSALRYTATTQDKNPWLGLSIAGQGSFTFVYPYTIHIAPQPANGIGTYTGSLTISGSTFAPDNKTVPVTMNVTTQPIAALPTGPINIRVAQGQPALKLPYTAIPLVIGSVGQTGITFGTPAVSPSTATWLTAAASGSGATLSVDPGTLSPGNYTASVTVPTNAVNAPSVTVPVNLTVVAKGAPVIAYQGVQDNATFVPGDTVAPGDVMVVKGEQLSFSDFTSGPPPPLATTVADTTVLVNGVPAPIYYTLPNQIAFQMPVNTPSGLATVQVQRTDGSPVSNKVSVNVASRAPKILQLFGGPWGAIVNADACRGAAPCVLGGSLPFPASFSQPGYPAYPARAGDTLTIYAIGLGPTSPSVATGQPAPAAEPFARLIAPPVVRFGEGPFAPTASPSFAALTPTFAGLYQVNVQVPANTEKGIITVSLVFPDGGSNAVQIAVQ